MIIRKSQLLIRTIIVRKQGPRGTRQEKLQKLDPMQLKGGFSGMRPNFKMNPKLTNL
jgi:hypothetical protein